MRSESRRVSGWTTRREWPCFALRLAFAFFSKGLFGLWHFLFWIKPINLAAAGANDFGCWRPLRRLDLAGNGPDEPNQLARNSRSGDHALLAHGQLPEALVQTL